jgi:hypothetical protein
MNITRLFAPHLWRLSRAQFVPMCALLFATLLLAWPGWSPASADSIMPDNKVPGSVESSARRLTNGLKHDGYDVLRGYFALYTIDDCQTSYPVMHTCYFNNPAAPYISPLVPHWPDEFVDPATRGAWGPSQPGYDPTYRFDPREAIVIVGQLPPPARYFGLQSYLFTRKGGWNTASPIYKILANRGTVFTDIFFKQVPNNTERILNFASLSNSINNVVIERQSDAAFDKKRFFIITPDQRMDGVVRSELGDIGVADRDIFTEPIPSTTRIGLDAASDDFITGLRYAQPADGGGAGTPSERWRTDLPLVVLRVRPARAQWQPQTYPPVVLDPRTAVDERPLKPKLDTLVKAVSERWGQPCSNADCSDRARTFIDAQSPPTAGGINLVGPKCTDIGMNCLGDGQDATYQFVPGLTLDAGEIYAVVGTLGTRTENATYVSLGVNNTFLQLGMLNLSDTQLADTARSYGEDTYRDFYLYYVTRDCAGLEGLTGGNCLPVPQSVLQPCFDAAGGPCKDVAFVERDYVRPGTLRGPNGDRMKPSTLPSMVITLRRPT